MCHRLLIFLGKNRLWKKLLDVSLLMRYRHSPMAGANQELRSLETPEPCSGIWNLDLHRPNNTLSEPQVHCEINHAAFRPSGRSRFSLFPRRYILPVNRQFPFIPVRRPFNFNPGVISRLFSFRFQSLSVQLTTDPELEEDRRQDASANLRDQS
ncbi:hypothetical protein BDZ97DRAFT_171748 [Flammula alnicola]|nr:hypothetical protein BDZ97DRAFT_171748 [Flammula alnicola]